MKNQLTSMAKYTRHFRNLLRDQSGLALIEFAYAMPLLMVLGFTGTETANLIQTQQKVSQTVLASADNAARVGTNTGLPGKVVYESDINDIFAGVPKQMEDEEFWSHSRIIMSSVEINSDGDPFIAWQRCMGDKDFKSTHGTMDTEPGEDELEGGVGEEGQKMLPLTGNALIYVELSTDYQPIFEQSIVGVKDFMNTELTQKAAFMVRDLRQMGALDNRTGSDPVASCS